MECRSDEYDIPASASNHRPRANQKPVGRRSALVARPTGVSPCGVDGNETSTACPVIAQARGAVRDSLALLGGDGNPLRPRPTPRGNGSERSTSAQIPPHLFKLQRSHGLRESM